MVSPLSLYEPCVASIVERRFAPLDFAPSMLDGGL
jgi:hypothetical protein